MKTLLIDGFGNITKEGLTLHFNQKFALNGGLITDEWWVSWDRISKALCGDAYNLYTKEQVEELLKKQREICADIACVILPSHPHFHGSKNVNNTSIANAPSPLES